MIYVLDSNILIARFDPTDAHYVRCAPLVKHILSGHLKTIGPCLILTEVAAGLARRTHDPIFARDVCHSLWKHPNMMWLDVTVDGAIDAAEFAIQSGTRGGADSIIAHFAKIHDLPLVTVDGPLKETAGRQLRVLWPEEVPTVPSVD